MDLGKNLSLLISLASTWAETQSSLISKSGIELSESQIALARCVGVKNPELIRVLVVNEIPVPEDEILKAACTQLNFLGLDTEGLTLSYGIFIKVGSEADRRLLAHEFRHVAQYEQHPSILSYLSIYIPELIQYGYANAPLELDAEAKAMICA
jgi:Domain of unknown function (DUF4157)